MSLSALQALGPNHVLEDFDCGKPGLNDWLLRHARPAQASGSAKTYVVTEGQRLVGYCSLAVGQIAIRSRRPIESAKGWEPIQSLWSSLLGWRWQCRTMVVVSALACCKMQSGVQWPSPNKSVFARC